MRKLALLLLLLAPGARADEALGMQLVREAQAKLAAGDAEGALTLLDRARTEWPGSDVVACTRGDALLAAGHHDEALLEYERALTGTNGHHARFNRGVAEDGAGETILEQAGVPVDVGALPEGPQPEMLQAVQAGRARLEQARTEFLRALDLQDEPAARESLAALNRRLDALDAIRQELERRAQEDQQGEQEDQPQDQPRQQPGEEPPPEGDPSQDGQPPPEGQPQDDQPPQQDAPPEQQPPEEQQDPSQQPEGEGEQDGQPSDAAPEGSEPQPARELSEEEVERLLDRLAQLEAEAREHAKAREAATRRAVEKDW